MQKTRKQSLIIDTDPGVDDVMAISFALFDEDVEVKLISTVAGNAPIKAVTNNTLNLLNFLNKKIKVAQGARKPLLEPLVCATHIHGTNLLTNFKTSNKNLLSEKHAIEEMKQIILTSEDKINIMAIGPLTNIALLISLYPETTKKIKKIFIMGGSFTRGNKTPMAEFNIATDPEAAKIVFDSGLNIVLAPLNVGWEALIQKKHLDIIAKVNKTGAMFEHLLRNYRGGSLTNGFRMYDACAWASMSKPDIFKYKKVYASIELASSQARGMTIIDLKNYWQKKPNIKLCVDIDAEKFNNWFMKSLEKCI